MALNAELYPDFPVRDNPDTAETGMETLRQHDEFPQPGHPLLHATHMQFRHDDVAKPDFSQARPSDPRRAEPFLSAINRDQFVEEERVRSLGVYPFEPERAQLTVGGEGVEPVVQNPGAGAPVFFANAGDLGLGFLLCGVVVVVLRLLLLLRLVLPPSDSFYV